MKRDKYYISDDYSDGKPNNTKKYIILFLIFGIVFTGCIIGLLNIIRIPSASMTPIHIATISTEPVSYIPPTMIPIETPKVVVMVNPDGSVDTIVEKIEQPRSPTEPFTIYYTVLDIYKENDITYLSVEADIGGGTYMMTSMVAPIPNTYKIGDKFDELRFPIKK